MSVSQKGEAINRSNFYGQTSNLTNNITTSASVHNLISLSNLNSQKSGNVYAINVNNTQVSYGGIESKSLNKFK